MKREIIIFGHLVISVLMPLLVIVSTNVMGDTPSNSAKAYCVWDPEKAPSKYNCGSCKCEIYKLDQYGVKGVNGLCPVGEQPQIEAKCKYKIKNIWGVYKYESEVCHECNIPGGGAGGGGNNPPPKK